MANFAHLMQVSQQNRNLAPTDGVVENMRSHFETATTLTPSPSSAGMGSRFRSAAFNTSPDSPVGSPRSAQGTPPSGGRSSSSIGSGYGAIQRRDSLNKNSAGTRQTRTTTVYGFDAPTDPDPDPDPEPAVSTVASGAGGTYNDSGYALSPSGGMVGLQNLGNTCFMNSMVQCLSFTAPLTAYFMARDHANDVTTTNAKTKGELVGAFAALVTDLWGERGSVVRPADFKRRIGEFAPRFLGYEQQDSQEFLRFVLDGLHEDLSRVPYPKPTLPPEDEGMADEPIEAQSWYALQRYKMRFDSKIVDTFAGQLKSTLQFTECGHESNTFDPFWDLSLPIPANKIERSKRYTSRASSSGSKRSCKLGDCLDEFVKGEVMQGDEMPTCEKCKQRRKCVKSLSIHRLPEVLVLHIKRFGWDMSGSKITTNVDFPLDKLDLSRYCSSDEAKANAGYKLYAVSNHMGGLQSGHYTAHCRHPTAPGTPWLSLDDSHVSTVAPSDLGGPSAYVLFYRRER